MQCARITISSMKKFAMNRSTARFSLGAGAVVVLAVILETALSTRWRLPSRTAAEWRSWWA